MVERSVADISVSANAGFSGQMPESMTPTIMPAPAWLGPPNCFCQTPVEPSSPRNRGVLTVSALRFSSFQTRSTLGDFSSALTWLAVRLAVKPLKETLYWWVSAEVGAPTERSTCVCLPLRYLPYATAGAELRCTFLPRAGLVAASPD